MSRGVEWSEAQMAILRTHYPSKGAAFVADLLEMGVKSVQRAAARHGVKSATCWTPEHIAALREHYPTKGGAFVGKIVGRAAHTVASKAFALGIRNDSMMRNGVPYVRKPAGSPSLVIAAPGRGPAYRDGPMVFTEQTRRIVCPTPPRHLWSNTHLT